jgi:predicted PurR-regulated permease PerM
MANRFYFIALTFFVLLLGYLSYQVLKPFLVPIAWAIVLSVLFYPLYAFILKYVRLTSIAAIIVICIILLIIIGPLSYLSFVLVMEMRHLIEYAQRIDAETVKGLMQHPVVDGTFKRLTNIMDITKEELSKTIMDHARQLGRDLVEWFTKRVGDIVIGLLNFIFMVLTTFFLLRDGPGFVKKIRDYLPFLEEQKGKITKLIEDIVISTMYGGVVIAIIQGTLGGAAFALLGIPSPVTWGVVMAILAFIPLVGPFMIYLPAAAYLIITGAVVKGIILVLFGVLAISTIDNFLRPYFIENRTKMSFIILFFSVLGGIKLFGLLGVIMGPLIVALFVSVIEIFRGMDESANISK